MEWYTNGVTNAIIECRQKMALFIVYVKDSSDASQKTTQSWQNEQVLDVLSNNLYVALEIIKDSTEFQQFSELFPVLVVPSIFCISPTGQQLAVGSGLVDSVQLRNILNQGFQQMKGSFTTGPQPVTTSRSISEEELDDESPPEQKEETQSEETKEEKAKRYQEKIKQQRIEREQQEKQHEISSELKRRRESQKIGEFKKEQEDREKQNWLKERQKEKAEQLRARQEVLAKLEQDKQERLAQKKKTNVTTTTTTTTDTELRSRSSGVTSSPVTTVPSVFSAVRSSSCRIQVKLPDGRSTVLLLSATDTVGILRDKIAEYIQVERQQISITCVYPRKELGFDLDDTNLDQHCLVPSGVILARTKTYKEPRQLSGQSAGGVLGVLLSFLHFIMQLFVTIKNGIIGLFWSSSADSTQVTTNRPVSRSTDDNTRIRRFKPDDYKDQDDNNTYNGNSTQQQ